MSFGLLGLISRANPTQDQLLDNGRRIQARTTIVLHYSALRLSRHVITSDNSILNPTVGNTYYKKRQLRHKYTNLK